jgi:hypothetical protein
MPAQYTASNTLGNGGAGHGAKKIATHFEVPSIHDPILCFAGHACGPVAEPLIVQIIILIRNVTMACFFVQKSGEISICFPILFYCTLDGIVRHF